VYSRPLLADGLRPPDTFSGPGFHARPLRLADAEADLAAVLAAKDRLKGAMTLGDPWPEGITLHENMIDLGWHEREFTQGHSYAWTVTAPEGLPVLGCAYLYPSDRKGFDAMAFFWVTPAADAIAPALEATFRTLVGALPLNTCFPGRDEPLTVWTARERRF
jgi:hypothetical protein